MQGVDPQGQVPSPARGWEPGNLLAFRQGRQTVHKKDPLSPDDKIRRLLRGGPQDVADGFNQLNERYQDPIVRWIERHFTSLRSSADDVWQETLEAMMKIVRERPQSLKESGPLRPLLRKIANRRAAMRLRRRLVPEEMPEPLLVPDPVERGDPVEYQEVCEVIFRTIGRFSKKLRRVWRVHLTHISDLGSFEDLRHAVWCQTGELLTRKAVIRRIQRGREILQEALRRHYSQ
jgi:DNA-directed RNA polymerase specialized sigma24 family protein